MNVIKTATLAWKGTPDGFSDRVKVRERELAAKELFGSYNSNLLHEELSCKGAISAMAPLMLALDEVAKLPRNGVLALISDNDWSKSIDARIALSSIAQFLWSAREKILEQYEPSDEVKREAFEQVHDEFFVEE